MTAQARVDARVKQVLTVDGLRFKDLDGSGTLDPYEDWRLSPSERTADLIARMTIDEKVGLMGITGRRMGIATPDKDKTSHDGVLDEEQLEQHPMFKRPVPGTTESIEERHLRHFIVREATTPRALATWANAMNEVAEGTRLGIPVIIASNSRNELGGTGMPAPDATYETDTFTLFPGTLGLGATGDLDLVRRFAEVVRAEFDATGIKKGYMYMADVLTDPRWQRFNGALGEDPAWVAAAIATLVSTLQGETLGPDSVALTTKHFPGGGARENGFDPHYAEGKFNVYRTPGSLEKYHLPPFQAAIDAGTSSIMPYYAIPSEEKSSMPQGPDGRFGTFEQVGFAYNEAILQLLRDMGFTGYINSDTGILDVMPWGVEDLSPVERLAKAVNAGVSVIADTDQVHLFRQAYDEGLLTEETIDARIAPMLAEMFALGLFDDPYRDPDHAAAVVGSDAHRALAEEAHRKSVVLLKNATRPGDSRPVLPLAPERLAGRKVYLELFEKDLKVTRLDALREAIATRCPEVEFTTDYAYADVAILCLNPVTGDYFKATGLMDLEVHEATNVTISKVRRIAEQVDTTVVAFNFELPFLLGNVEPLTDGMVAGFDTTWEAMVDVITGAHAPTGRMPFTLPADAAAIAVDEDDICASPNDVPGYDKEQYMDGRPYAYVDAAGNRYGLGFGLAYPKG